MAKELQAATPDFRLRRGSLLWGKNSHYGCSITGKTSLRACVFALYTRNILYFFQFFFKKKKKKRHPGASDHHNPILPPCLLNLSVPFHHHHHHHRSTSTPPTPTTIRLRRGCISLAVFFLSFPYTSSLPPLLPPS